MNCCNDSQGFRYAYSFTNDVDTSRDFLEPLTRTKEAQEFRLTEMYGEALSNFQHGQIEKAHSLFQSILQDPISIKAEVEPVSGSKTMLQLRYSALKNIAETFSKQGSDHHDEAVDCFLQASAIDGKDVVLWNRLAWNSRLCTRQSQYCSSSL